MDYPSRIKNLEAIRRSARAAEEHTLADQLTQQIEALRKERANSRPLHERLKSAEAKVDLAQQEITKANDFLIKATERRETADKNLEAATTELEALRQEQRLQPQQTDEADPTLEHLLEYFDELADAVEATPAAKTARIYAALTAVRTILLQETGHDDADADAYSAKSEDDHSMHVSEVEDTADEDISSDHTCESVSPSVPTKVRRTKGTRTIPHYHMNKDSDGDQGAPRTSRRRSKTRSPSTSMRNRSRSPTIPA